MKHIYIYSTWLISYASQWDYYLIFVMEQLEANSITLELLSVL